MRKRLLSVSLLAVTLAFPAAAADVLFPSPLHLTRQLHDSIGGSTTVIEQYCHGNRVVSVHGPLTTIADYGKGELTEIHRDERTYSVTRFDEVAKALRAGAPELAAPKGEWKLRASTLTQLRTNRASDVLEGDLDEADGRIKRHTRVAVDRTVSLSKDALDVVIGAAYPNRRRAEDHVIVEAARPRGNLATNSPGERMYALPVEQHTTFTIDDQRAEVREVVSRVAEEVVPSELVTIPPDAKLVQSRLVQRMQAIEQIESAGRTSLPSQQQ